MLNTFCLCIYSLFILIWFLSCVHLLQLHMFSHFYSPGYILLLRRHIFLPSFYSRCPVLFCIYCLFLCLWFCGLSCSWSKLALCIRLVFFLLIQWHYSFSLCWEMIHWLLLCVWCKSSILTIMPLQVRLPPNIIRQIQHSLHMLWGASQASLTPIWPAALKHFYKWTTFKGG